MLTISNIPPERRQPRGLDRLLPVLSRGLATQSVDFVLIGAVARACNSMRCWATRRGAGPVT